MGILEWSISARDSFLYLAICLSIPSALLYLAQIVTILRHKQFHNSFYALFIIRAVPDLLYLLDSFYCFRLPILFGSVLFPLYSLLPNWMIGGLPFFLAGYTFQANNLATAFILLNRLTAIAVPLKHDKLWKCILPLIGLAVFCLPISTNWPMFKMTGKLQIGANDSSPSTASNATSADVLSFFLYEEDNATPYLSFLICFDSGVSVVFMVVCIVINIFAVYAYKCQMNKHKFNQQQNAPNNLERKLFIYASITFCGHALIACLFIGLYIATIRVNFQMVSALLTHYPWVVDTGSVVLSSWLLLWASDSFRGQLLLDYRIPRIRFGTRATNCVASVNGPNEQNNPLFLHQGGNFLYTFTKLELDTINAYMELIKYVDRVHALPQLQQYLKQRPQDR
ncbi:hypothetical protein niasHT_017635 [Heterodera trifolii]|uniref:Serpentine receptor class gamma n=1 Tax=Heterodera trifolii TaxID=157864 RepID=A0ABD2L8D0_9BILA